MKTQITEEKLTQLFNEHSAYVYRTALLLTRSEALADDITQETFIKVMNKYDLYDEGRPFRPWLNRIAVNITRNILRKQTWLKLFGQHMPEAVDTAGGQGFVPDSSQEVWQHVAKLSLKCREVIVLHYYQDLSLEEAAQVLGIPLGTCKSRLNSALSKLRIVMKQDSGNALFQGGKLYER